MFRCGALPVMALISQRLPSRRVGVCHLCHSWVFDHLTKDHAERRCTPQDAFLTEVTIRVPLCSEHHETGFERACNTLKRAVFGDYKLPGEVEQRQVWITSGELEVMRRSGGAGLYSGAPTSTCDSNTHFATYRFGTKSRPGDAISIAALDHIFGYLASAIMGGRVADRSCCCLRLDGTGMRTLVPCKREKVLAVEPPSTPIAVTTPATELMVPTTGEMIRLREEGASIVSKIPGVDLCYDPNEPDSPPLAVRFLPEIEERLFWLNSQRNVEAAIKGRIVEPEVPVTLTEAERAEVKAISEVLVKMALEDKALIAKIVQQKCGLKGWASKKWSPERATRALRELHQKYAPRYKFDASIKLEPSKRSKPPRLLVADGDAGQVMAWVLIGTMEAWLFKRYKHRSIKGLPKTEAMKRVVESLRQQDPRMAGAPGLARGSAAATAHIPDVPTAIVENDGSAWDACMSSTLRDLTENPVMDVFADIVGEFFLIEGTPDFIDARKASNRLVELNINVRKAKGEDDKVTAADIPKGKCWRTVIRAIRRSGCRGTSVLNFLANMICWCWVIGGADAVRLVRPQGARVVCMDGLVRFVKMCFEGDDSILSFYCMNNIGASGVDTNMTHELMAVMTARWAKLGHRPKLFWRQPHEVAEFTGWHFYVGRYGLSDEMCAPDVYRNLVNMTYSISPAAIAAAMQGDTRAFMSAVAPGIIARLYPLAARYPQLCRLLYSKFSRHLSDGAVLHRDEVYHLELEPEDLGFSEADDEKDMDSVIDRLAQRFCPIQQRFELELAKGDDSRESEFASVLNFVPNPDDYRDMLELLEGGFNVGNDGMTFACRVQELRVRPVVYAESETSEPEDNLNW